MAESLLPKVKLRLANAGDCRRIWEWRNEPVTRQASFKTKYIPFKDHQRWFDKKLASPDTRIFVVMGAENREIGYVRFELRAGEAEISISIDKSQRGKGYGTAAMRLACQSMQNNSGIQRIIAYLKPGNVASRKAFERAGFVFSGFKTIEGIKAIEMVWK